MNRNYLTCELDPYLTYICNPHLPSSGSARGRWYKFNDNVVEEFEMNDETLEYECFGGEYRPKVYDQCKYNGIVFHLCIRLHPRVTQSRKT